MARIPESEVERLKKGVQGAVERKTGLSGTRILARMNSQTADGQIESVYAVLGYMIRSSQLRCTHLGYVLEPRRTTFPAWCALTVEKWLLNAVNMPLPSYPEAQNGVS
jgi:hypothetical protein